MRGCYCHAGAYQPVRAVASPYARAAPVAEAADPLALARAVENNQPTAALPGGCLYEPKWDGFRAGEFSGGHGSAIWERSARDLSGRLPDLASTVHGQLPPRYVLDAEAVIWSGERIAFASPQARMTGGRKTLPALIRRGPASLVILGRAPNPDRETPSLLLPDSALRHGELVRL